jgi:hypothetical protein
MADNIGSSKEGYGKSVFGYSSKILQKVLSSVNHEGTKRSGKNAFFID